MTKPDVIKELIKCLLDRARVVYGPYGQEVLVEFKVVADAFTFGELLKELKAEAKAERKADEI